MNPQVSEVMQSLFRWFHIFFGVIWIGHLYFFNFVNGFFAATMDAETKKKVVPQLMPRALFWFRYGALWTWVTGVLLLGLVFYHDKIAFEDSSWTAARGVLVLLSFVGVFAYDALAKAVKNPKVLAVAGLILLGSLACFFNCAGFTLRSLNIHLGVLLGSIMAFNVWFRIWPAQQKIITAVRDGTPPDAALVALAGLRSRHNTFLSFPLLWVMINQHQPNWPWWSVLGVIVFAWIGMGHIYKKAAKVSGF